MSMLVIQSTNNVPRAIRLEARRAVTRLRPAVHRGGRLILAAGLILGGFGSHHARRRGGLRRRGVCPPGGGAIGPRGRLVNRPRPEKSPRSPADARTRN